MKDALGHGSNGGWGQHPATGKLKTASKYQSFNGRKDAVVRTERMPAGHLWQHGNQYGYANSVADAKATVESRVADEDRYKTHEPVTTSQFDGPRERSGLGNATHNENGHAWGSPEALKDFKDKYNRGRAEGNAKNRAEGKAFRSAKGEINRLRKQGK
jgi:hypothetical protein